MRMTTLKLIAIRLFSSTLGRYNFFDKIFKKLTIMFFVKIKEDKYVASSKFFDLEELK